MSQNPSGSPYPTEPGSSLDEMRRIEQEEGFLKAVGAYDIEDEREKLQRLDEDFYENSQQEQWEEDARRGDVLQRRLAKGEISEQYRWMIPNKGYEGEDFQQNFQILHKEAMKGQTWDSSDYRDYMRYTVLDREAEVELMKDIFPKFKGFLEQELKKAKDSGSMDVRDNHISRALSDFLDGKDLE